MVQQKGYLTDTYQRQYARLQDEIELLDNQLNELDVQYKMDVTIIDEVLALSRNIYQTYLDAPDFLKRHYLRFFFDAIYIDGKKITKIVETPLFSVLRNQHHIIIREHWLPALDSIRTSICGF